MCPIIDERRNGSLVKGDKIRIYGITEIPENSHFTNRMLLISFKKNTSKKIVCWIVNEDEFIKNISLNPSRYSKKLFANKEKTSTFVEIY